MHRCQQLRGSMNATYPWPDVRSACCVVRLIDHGHRQCGRPLSDAVLFSRVDVLYSSLDLDKACVLLRLLCTRTHMMMHAHAMRK
jgi:hypothetical protein